MKRFFLLCLSLAALANASFKITIKEHRIEAGQTFHLQLIVPLKYLPQNRSKPQLKTTNGFKLLALDSAKEEIPYDSFFSRLNKDQSGAPDIAQVYTFEVKAPQKTGRLVLGSLLWKANGKLSIISDQHQVTLFRAAEAPALEASITLSKQSVYVGEQFSIGYELHSYENVISNSLYPDSVNFGDDFASFSNEDPKIESNPIEGTNENQLTSQLVWWLSPNKSGTIQIPPLLFNYTSKTILGTTRDTVEQVAYTAPISIKVLPLPNRGKPSSFSGMVGSYKFSANLDRTNLKMGDSLTLTFNISGDGAIGEIANPKLPELRNIRWEISEAKANKNIEDSKVVTSKEIKAMLYPQSTGTFKIPAITYSWFNPAIKRYEKASAGPWTIEVE